MATPTQRFLAKVEKTPTCWLWTGTKNPNGYGRFSHNGRTVQAHRFSYEMHIDTIPPGMQLDHLCRVRHCVRPNHLEPVTQQENLSRKQRPCTEDWLTSRSMRLRPLTLF